MGFASAWLKERTIFPELIHEAPGRETCIIIVIPSYDEPGIERVLNSLAHCAAPPCNVEVLVVINAPLNAGRESLLNNKVSLENIEAWKRKNESSFMRLYPFIAQSEGVKGWGVGLARKTGMDEAVRRFDQIDRPDGIILSLDADCTVSSDYLQAVYNEFYSVRDRHACSIYFEHPLRGDEFSKEVYSCIAMYELHLRYYHQALLFTDYPDVFHTVGSATGVRALIYIRAGGMNRKQAGEDFYFIQKLIPLGGYFALNTTTVYPSPRPSFRVPFGTGASIAKMTGEESVEFMTYNFDAFRELKYLFGKTEALSISSSSEIIAIYRELPQGIRSFISEGEFVSRIAEIRNNTAGYISFRKRFFSWFNMFRMVKFLNHVNQEIYSKISISVAASELLRHQGKKFIPGDILNLLDYYRLLDQGI